VRDINKKWKFETRYRSKNQKWKAKEKSEKWKTKVRSKK
jgi:hypothetical protein